jgi:protein-tyrosine phosphatase
MTSPSVLMLCLGNICRSPLAEGALRARAAARGVAICVDSAGTGDWHVGNAPDRRAQAEARRQGIDISGLSARQIAPDDFYEFDLILAADHDVLADARELAPAGSPARVMLMLDMVPGRAGEAVADPYYGGPDGFERNWADVSALADALLDRFVDQASA